MYFSLRKMKELIEEQCKYGTRDQLLLYENSLVEDLMGDQGKSDRFPCTSTENPVFLYHCIDPGNSTEDHPGKPFVRKCLIINILIYNVILYFCYWDNLMCGNTICDFRTWHILLIFRWDCPAYSFQAWRLRHDSDKHNKSLNVSKIFDWKNCVSDDKVVESSMIKFLALWKKIISRCQQQLNSSRDIQSQKQSERVSRCQSSILFLGQKLWMSVPFYATS